MRFFARSSVISATMLLPFGAQAFAQETPQSSERLFDTGEIVVTARRISESIQKVPVAIEALSQSDLTRRSVTSAADLGKAVAGLSSTSDSGNPGLTTFSIRGRGQNYGAASGSVETYLADIPLSASFQMPSMQPQFFDVTSFQVLKGPQGTLFGRNTTGGAVVISPEAPKLGRTGGYLRLQGGTYGNFQAEGAINIPLGERMAFRIAAFRWQRDGYMRTAAIDPLTGAVQIDNTSGKIIGAQTFSNVNSTQIRTSLQIEPNETLQNLTIFSYAVDKNRATAAAGLRQGARVAPTVDNPYGGTVSATPKCGDYCFYIDVDLKRPATRHYFLANTTTLALTGDLQLKNIFGFIKSRGYTNDASDTDGFSSPSIDLAGSPRPRQNQQITDELQLSGKSGILSYILGGMYDRTQQPTSLDQIPIFSISYSGALTGFRNAMNFQALKITSKSLYSSMTVTPINKLNISGGFRYTWIDVKNFQGVNSYAPGQLQPTRPLSIATGSRNFSGPTYNIGADYSLEDDVMVYAGFRHGFKRGGFNPSLIGMLEYGPEEVDDYTLGAKSSFRLGGMRGYANVELFHDIYRGMQVSYLGTMPRVAQLITFTANIQKVRYQGVDASLSLSPTSWLELNGSYVYNDSKIKTFTVPNDITDLSVNTVPYSPTNKFIVSGRLHGQLPGNVGEAVLFANVSHQDMFYAGIFNRKLPAASAAAFRFDNVGSFCAPNGLCGATVPGYTTVDVRVELNHAFGSQLDVAAGVSNLTNKLFYTGASSTLQYGIEGFAYGTPRMWTFEVRAKF